jgi:hypothetical protein
LFFCFIIALNKIWLEEFKIKKYLLLIEDEKLWNKFKENIQKDINSEIIDLIRKKINIGDKGK